MKDGNKKHVTNEVQASHMGDYQSSVESQNIFDVTALEIPLTSKLQILGQTLPNKEFRGFQQISWSIHLWGFKLCRSKCDMKLSIWFLSQRLSSEIEAPVSHLFFVEESFRV